MPEFHTSDGCSIFYDRSGRSDGRKAVLVHGLCAERGIWRLAAPALAPRFNVLAMDCRGHGESGADEPFTLSRIGLDAAEMGGPNSVGIGHGMGAQALLSHAVDHPGWFGALVLVGAGRTALSSDSGWSRTRQIAAAKVRETNDMADAWSIYLEGGLFGVNSDELPDELVADWRDDFLEVDPRAFTSLAAELSSIDLTDQELAKITVPTLIVTGENDLPYASHATALAEAISTATLAWVPDAGHTPQLDSATEFNEIVFEFLRANL